MGDTVLDVRGRAGPAQVRDGAKGLERHLASPPGALPGARTGLVCLIALWQGVNWGGISLAKPCWNHTGVLGGRDTRKWPAQISVVWRGQELVDLEGSQW